MIQQYPRVMNDTVGAYLTVSPDPGAEEWDLEVAKGGGLEGPIGWFGPVGFE
eukprot:CAMPEP_0169478808 /NCGR_PEP_ID=MMETSP1042-20121227/28672_1 /TAXON_ID=464988 /ORGANISM="Hemiselmis andersenii, Strain CCMP1180" /LENGTH=51 /DNA_ID=CAMNT_0009593299 /DNA_START=474 /DNA_END=630 /DNA_ORIENTATION=-